MPPPFQSHVRLLPFVLQSLPVLCVHFCCERSLLALSLFTVPAIIIVAMLSSVDARLLPSSLLPGRCTACGTLLLLLLMLLQQPCLSVCSQAVLICWHTPLAFASLCLLSSLLHLISFTLLLLASAVLFLSQAVTHDDAVPDERIGCPGCMHVIRGMEKYVSSEVPSPLSRCRFSWRVIRVHRL